MIVLQIMTSIVIIHIIKYHILITIIFLLKCFPHFLSLGAKQYPISPIFPFNSHHLQLRKFRACDMPQMGHIIPDLSLVNKHHRQESYRRSQDISQTCRCARGPRTLIYQVMTKRESVQTRRLQACKRSKILASKDPVLRRAGLV